jgi:arylsulfatase A-like enzyme
MKTIGLGAASMALLGWTSCQRKKAFQGRPNVVIIFTDDQGYADVGCFGAEGFQTPNLDRMAEEGIRFTDFYVAAPSCTPSRAALMTGCYPQRVSMPHVILDKAKIGINEDEFTMAELFKQQGYDTAMFGKWHLGHHPEFLPVRHGFDTFFGLPYSNDIWPFHPQSERYDFTDLPLIEGEEILEYNPDQTKLTTWYTERAVSFIDEHKDSSFFLYVAHNMPHVPLYVSDKYKNNSERGLYGDVIEEIDWSVGEILAALKRNGIDDRTLVIFTSDNGPWLSYGNHAGSAKPLREGKGTTFEGGMREPCIMRWPGTIPADSECREMATAMDLLPTFANLIGGHLPEDHVIDGKDIRPLLFGKRGAKTPHEAFFYYRGWRLEAVRSGKWKLHVPHEYGTLTDKFGSDGIPADYGNNRILATERIGLSLFDLDNDISETTNVADDHPEIVKRLLEYMQEVREDLGDRIQGVKGKGVRPCGRVDR